MNYGLGSDDPEELAYYNKSEKRWMIWKKNQLKKGYPLVGIPPKEWANESEYFFINWWESDAYWSAFVDDS